ncbi:hypothetical protein K493DRAFT_304706 [Basidiobolus meristosporus CBS 931.73]|uniref:Fucose-specific lectin n=1 Tax=Basidiobolus meristosporus CBS 931.73 TaxID=1314790 RepID=A0A1Y1XY66_9FUNG|nr:hypothetical protein K493DRAFT_304706 [Basidiobolus meristosporus CBS 931.73]|eukprot:ORX90681.1 hypothetical protein K493DRAFT_304706 [Basidiobolus meristosporus CBS 931.73]
MRLPLITTLAALAMARFGSGFVYRTNDDVYALDKVMGWKEVQDYGFTTLSAGVDDSVWAVSEGNLPYRFTGKRWGLIPGKLQAVAGLDMNTAWGISPGYSVYRFFNGIWQVHPGKLTAISAATNDGYVEDVEHVWGISPSNTLWYCYFQPRLNKCKWKAVPKPNGLRVLAVASVGDGTAFALFDVRDALGNVVYRWNGSSWSLIDERLVSIGNGCNGKVAGFTAEGTIRVFSSDTNSVVLLEGQTRDPAQVRVGRTKRLDHRGKQVGRLQTTQPHQTASSPSEKSPPYITPTSPSPPKSLHQTPSQTPPQPRKVRVL